MGEQAQIGVKVDKDLKDEVDEILRSLDVKPTAAINGLYHYIVQHRELPFIISTQVNKPSNLHSNLFMDYLLLKRTMQEFYQNREHEEPLTEKNLELLKYVVREFIANFRQIENALYPLNDEKVIDWKKAFNGAKRAFYVLETHVRFETYQGHYLEDSGIIKLSLALKMIIDAEAGV
jgi:addiction module RelB/DinJ family antitoxin